MDAPKLIEIKVRLYGLEALEMAKDEAARHKAAGDDQAYERAVREVELVRQQLERDSNERARKASINPEDSPLFAGITNLALSDENFEFCRGLRLERVFAHVMAPYMVAFSPAEKGQPHPGPWRAASGGLGFDIAAQLTLEAGVRPTGFDRLNTLWWITSLIKLMHSVGMRVPVISNTSFLNASEATEEPVFWPMEMDNRGFAFDGFAKDLDTTTSSLEWIGRNFQAGAKLMDLQSFNLAYRATEAAQRASTLAEATIMAWASIDALLRPGRKNVAHRLCLALSTYLEQKLTVRDKLYGEAKRLYATRGQVVHAAETPSTEDVVATFQLARRCILLTIENGHLPDFSQLEARWKAKI